MSKHSFSHSSPYSYYYYIRLYCSSFRGILSCRASSQRFFLYTVHVLLVVTWWLWKCSCYADLRMIKQVVIIMIVSLIRLVFILSAVAIISPHLLLPILNSSSCYLYLPMLTTGLSYLCHIHLYSYFSVSLNDHFCVVLITWSFLVRHLTNGEVSNTFLLPKYVSCPLKANQDVRKISCF